MRISNFPKPAVRRLLFGSGARLCGFIARLPVLLSLAASLPFPGCDKISDGVIDPKALPPFVTGALVRPDSIRLTTLPENNGLLTVSVDLSLRVSQPAGTPGPGSVNVNVFSSSGTDPFLQEFLRDDGSIPDSTASDGVYSARLQFTVQKSASGRYRVQFRAMTTDGLVSNLIEKPLFMIRSNNPPVISNLQAPDTIIIPVVGDGFIKISVNASDSDGPADIKQVYFFSLDSSDPTRKFFLKDDGDVGVSGDVLDGDGIYTIKILPPTVRKIYRFLFQASDAFGDTSASILHQVTVQ